MSVLNLNYVDCIKIVLATLVLTSSQLALKYSTSIIASMIAVFPVIALVTYSSSKVPQKTALHLAVFMIISGIAFLLIHFLPDRKFLWVVCLIWVSMTYFAFNLIS